MNTTTPKRCTDCGLVHPEGPCPPLRPTPLENFTSFKFEHILLEVMIAHNREIGQFDDSCAHHVVKQMSEYKDIHMVTCVPQYKHCSEEQHVEGCECGQCEMVRRHLEEPKQEPTTGSVVLERGFWKVMQELAKERELTLEQLLKQSVRCYQMLLEDARLGVPPKIQGSIPIESYRSVCRERDVAQSHAEQAQVRAKRAEQELADIDLAFGNRQCFDHCKTRVEKISHAIETARVAEKKVTDVKWALRQMMIGSCGCLIKSDDPKHHHDTCRYRIAAEALAALSDPKQNPVPRFKPWTFETRIKRPLFVYKKGFISDRLITAWKDDCVEIGAYATVTYQELFNNWLRQDGQPCGEYVSDGTVPQSQPTTP